MDRDDFLRNVEPLFEQTLEEEGDAYDDVIYHVERPLRQGIVARIRSFVGSGDGDPDDPTVAETVDEAVANVHYPDTEPLLKLDGDFDLPTAVGVLHFYQPHFPLYRREAVDGLQDLRFDVDWTTELSRDGLDAYRDYEETIQNLVWEVPFRYFPEIHYYRQRVIEGALAAVDGDDA